MEWFSSDVMTMPVRKFPDHKRSFLPSRSEKEKVSKYVHALKMGWMKSSKVWFYEALKQIQIFFRVC